MKDEREEVKAAQTLVDVSTGAGAEQARGASERTDAHRADSWIHDVPEAREPDRGMAELREAQERLEAAQKAGQIGSWHWEPDSGKTYWSDTMWMLYGFNRPQASAEMRWEASLYPADAQRARQRVAELLADNDESEYRDEFRIILPDDTVRWIESVARIVRDENGRPLRVSGVNIDITNRKNAEEALRSSEERLRLLTDSFSDIAITTTNSNGIVTSWNPGAETIFCYTADEMIGQSADILFTPEDRAANVPEIEMATARKTGRASDERWHIRKDGTRFFASGVMVPLIEDGRLVGYAKIARDLTRDKQAEGDLKRAHDTLESRVEERTAALAEANRSLRMEMAERQKAEEERIALLGRIVTAQEEERSRIARDIHDQLGQQLTALRLKIASLVENTATGERFERQIERLQEISARLDSEISFLAWQLRPAALDDLGFVPATKAYVAEWSRHHDIPVEFHDGRVEERRFDPVIETNLYRILQEALNNIYKHANAMNVNVVVELRRAHIVLIIEDDGVGFNVEDKKARTEAGGLGLIGMRERAAIVGGTVEIESGPGKGTTIFVRVPIPADGDVARTKTPDRKYEEQI